MTSVDGPSPWHRGELEAQQRAGVDPRHTASVTGFLRPYLNEQHRAFYPRLPFIVVGVVDAADRPWATLLEGQPGFMEATDDTHLRIASAPASGDPAASALSTGGAIGLLGIELETRRRNRLNGHVSDARDGSLEVEVDRAYGNCPKYIHTRDLRFHEIAAADLAPPERFGTLDEEAVRTIALSGTFFVASATGRPATSVDVSHRGGRPGFVEVDGDWLTIPDFQGNQFFNTLGNFLVNPKAGLLFPDFRSGDVLQLTGRVEVLFDSPRLAAFEGAQRLWRFHVEEMVRRRGVLHWRGEIRDESTEAELTGTWADALARERAATARGWRPFRVERVTDEASDVRSFTLKPAGDDLLAAGSAGMHLVIRLAQREAAATIASYSLSRMPVDGSYRISVKRGGQTSRAVWAALGKGAVVELRGPQGVFVVDVESPRPVVLLSTGIGITPMLAMAEQTLESDRRAGKRRRIHFLHGARDGAAMPFRAELLALQAASNGLLTVTRCFSRPSASDRPSIDFEFGGRLDLQTLRRTLAFDDYDFYLCGPAGFMQQMYDGLRSLNIADGRIRAEAFGPSSLRRDAVAGASPSPGALEAATTATTVTFARAHGQAIWSPSSGTLLELAEQSGLEPEFGCRDGSCGTCRTRVVSGQVAYPGRTPPEVGDDTALICCAVPARTSDNAGLVLDL
jgi:ferredoxin-NADP reductase/predicted pyridoxine 5'-phosphate oxidase superfamily flavin-nucleotide-binding protein